MARRPKPQQIRRPRRSRTLRNRAAALTLTLVVGALAGTASARAAAVTPVGCDPNPLTAGTLLKNAVIAASPGDTLTLTSYCVYGFDDTNKSEATSALVIDKDLTITGNHATLKRTNGTLRLIHLINPSTHTTLTLDTLAVLNGNPGGSAQHGGGIRTDQGTTLLATNLTLQGNAAALNALGGGLAAFGDTTLTGGTIKDNHTLPGSNGGGAYVNGATAFHHVTVTGNRAGTGGGIFLSTGDLTIDQNSVISSNTAQNGGGLDAGGNSLTLTDSRITDNRAIGAPFGSAGGLRAHAATMNVTGSLISGNTVTAQQDPGGAGIYAFNGSATLSGTTVSNNRLIGPGSFGAGIVTAGDFSLNVLNGSVINGNLASGPDSIGGGIFSAGATVVTDSSVNANKVTGTGSYAAGIYNPGGSSSSFSLTNSTVNNNTAPNAPAPGGIWTAKQFTTTTGSTITGNTPTNCLLSPVIPTGCSG